MNQQWHTLFSGILPEDRILESEPMSRHTTFGIGGPADCLLLPDDAEELRSVLHITSEAGCQVFIIGGGANLLVRDGGIRGVVVSTQRLKQIYRRGNEIVSQTGNSTSSVARFACREGLSGMEFACGIPGSIGGAVYMNAGAYNGEISGIVASAVVCSRRGEMRKCDASDIDYAYRHSLFMSSGDAIVEVTLRLISGDTSEIQNRMDEFMLRRQTRQPLEYRSAGSTFKRPEGHFVGEMIENLGLKGFSVGDAQVSEKHAGFLINRGHATCAQMLELMEEVQKRVQDRYGVRIEPEVRIVGEDRLLQP